MFSRPEIQELLRKYQLVRLYTDRLPPGAPPRPSAQENRVFQRETFGNSQLPLYVIVKPLGDGKFKTLAMYEEGLINDVPGFARFLREPIEQHQAAAAGQDTASR